MYTNFRSNLGVIQYLLSIGLEEVYLSLRNNMFTVTIFHYFSIKRGLGEDADCKINCERDKDGGGGIKGNNERY